MSQPSRQRVNEMTEKQLTDYIQDLDIDREVATQALVSLRTMSDWEHDLRVIFRGADSTAEWMCSCGWTETVTAYSQSHAAEQVRELHPCGNWHLFDVWTWRKP